MSKEQELLEKTQEVVDAKTEVLDLKMGMVSDELYRQTRQRLLAWAGSVFGATTAVLGVFAFFQLGDLINNRATDAVAPAVDEVEQALVDAQVLISVQEARLDELNSSVETLAASLEDAEARLNGFDRLLETERFLTRDGVGQLLDKTLFAMNVTSWFCSEDQDREFYASFRAHFGGEFQGSNGSLYRNFPLPSPQQRIDITVDNHGFPLAETLFCTKSNGELVPTIGATPFLADTRDLPLLAGFIIRTVTIIDSEGNSAISEAQLGTFRSSWLAMQTAALQLRVGGGYHLLAWNSRPFEEAGFFGDEGLFLPLNPIEFFEETLSDGRVRLHVYLPLQEPVSLSTLIR